MSEEEPARYTTILPRRSKCRAGCGDCCAARVKASAKNATAYRSFLGIGRLQLIWSGKHNSRAEKRQVGRAVKVPPRSVQSLFDGVVFACPISSEAGG